MKNRAKALCAGFIEITCYSGLQDGLSCKGVVASDNISISANAALMTDITEPASGNLKLINHQNDKFKRFTIGRSFNFILQLPAMRTYRRRALNSQRASATDTLIHIISSTYTLIRYHDLPDSGLLAAMCDTFRKYDCAGAKMLLMR